MKFAQQAGWRRYNYRGARWRTTIRRAFEPASSTARPPRPAGRTSLAQWGGCKVALLKTNETGNDGEEVWALLLSEAPAYKPDEKPAAPAPSSAPARYVEQVLPDDSIPFAPEFR